MNKLDSKINSLHCIATFHLLSLYMYTNYLEGSISC